MDPPNNENDDEYDIIPSNWIVVTNDEGEVVSNGNNFILQHKFKGKFLFSVKISLRFQHK